MRAATIILVVLCLAAVGLTGYFYFTASLVITGIDCAAVEDSQFLTYTVHLRNESFLRAEVAEIQVTPVSGDILQMAETAPASIPARAEGSVRGTILTGKDMHNVREMVISYYLWGMPFSVKTTYSQ